MPENVIVLASQILIEMDLPFQVSVLAYYLTDNNLQLVLLFELDQPGYLFLKGSNRCDLEFLKSQILFRHRRKGFCRLKNIYTQKTEIPYRSDTSFGKLCIAVMKKNPAPGIDRAGKSHTAFKVFPSYEFHAIPP